MPKQVMIQTVMSLDDFAFCQNVFKTLCEGVFPFVEKGDTFVLKAEFFIDSNDMQSIRNLRNLFLPDIKII